MASLLNDKIIATCQAQGTIARAKLSMLRKTFPILALDRPLVGQPLICIDIPDVLLAVSAGVPVSGVM